jgi:putative serine protease PepD
VVLRTASENRRIVDGMSDEQREHGRDASASTGDSRTAQYPVPSYVGAAGPAPAQDAHQQANPSAGYGPPQGPGGGP